MSVRRGDLVIVHVPFTSGVSGKSRPALVVQSDARNLHSADTVVAVITTKTRHVASDPTQLLIELATPEGKQSGLLYDSVVKCGHLITIEQSLIGRTIGSLPDAVMEQVAIRIKLALDLS